MTANQMMFAIRPNTAFTADELSNIRSAVYRRDAGAISEFSEHVVHISAATRKVKYRCVHCSGEVVMWKRPSGRPHVDVHPYVFRHNYNVESCTGDPYDEWFNNPHSFSVVLKPSTESTHIAVDAFLRNDKPALVTSPREIRPGQKEFREKIIAACNGSCVITKCPVESAIEAAHVVPYGGEDSDGTDNGIALRADLHKLFDAGLLRIHPDTRAVRISKEASYYQSLDGKVADCDHVDKRCLQAKWDLHTEA